MRGKVLLNYLQKWLIVFYGFQIYYLTVNTLLVSPM